MTEKTNNTDNTDNTDSTPERLLAGRGIPLTKLKEWRESGELREGEHYRKEGRAYHLTPAGVARARELAGLDPQPPPEPERVPVVAQLPGAMPRILRCKLESGVMVSVRLTAPRVFAAQFRRNDRLAVLPTAMEGIYEYDGVPPRRSRI